jgi:hypothetical protein
MTINEIRVGDIGTNIELTVKDETNTVVDISTATTKQLIFRKPNGTLLTKNATFTTDGTDGKIYITTVAGDLDQVGVWYTQAYIEITPYQWHSSYEEMDVYSNL